MLKESLSYKSFFKEADNLARPTVRFILLLYCFCGVLLVSHVLPAQTRNAGLSSTLFKNPPPETHIYTWWHWMNKGITKAGITKDLESMKQQGIRGATILNVNQFQGKDFGVANVKFDSPEWYDVFMHSLKEANRLGLEIGVHNCDGWSNSGGPWITPEQSMKQFVWSKDFVEGGKVQKILKKPFNRFGFYKDVYVVAFPSAQPSPFYKNLPKVTTSDNQEADFLVDGSPLSTVKIKIGVAVQFEFKKNYKSNTLLVHLNKPFAWRGTDQTVDFELAISDDGVDFKKVAELQATLLNQTVLIQFPESSAKFFKVTLKDMLKKQGIGIDWGNDIDISELALLNKGERGIFQPSINYLQAKTITSIADNVNNFSMVTAVPRDENTINNASEAIDISDKMAADGTLHWNAPAGYWTILRFGYTTTGAKNQPASVEGEGLECDKMDTTALNIHFKSFPQKLIEAAGKFKGNTFKYLFIDSWECLYQNWTPGFEKEFEKSRGYTILPYLPVLCGEIVESSEHSEAFLHDFRKTIAELIELRYFKQLSKLCHQQGMELHAEAIYGGIHAPPLDILKTNSYFDVPMTEFWGRIDPTDSLFRYNPANQVTGTFVTHAATMYNKSIVAAESYTSSAHFSEAPWELKLWGDKAFTEGVNRIVLHSFVHQPNEQKPGMTLGPFGSIFNRNNPWWTHANAWFDYQARVQYMLQKGRTVSDVLVYMGDKLPIAEVASKPSTYPSGIRFDFCNNDILIRHATVNNGRITLHNGLNYGVLVLEDSVMNLSTLVKIEELVRKGAILIAPKPTRTLSLKNYHEDNDALQKLSNAMWGKVNGKTIYENQYGAGKVIFGKPLETVLAENKLTPDVYFKNSKPTEFMHIHKKTLDEDYYYLVNKNEGKAVQAVVTFRLTGKIPQIWNPINGEISSLKNFTEEGEATTISLTLNAKQSIFVVFVNKSKTNIPELNTWEKVVRAKMLVTPINATLTLVDEPTIRPFSINEFKSLTKFSEPDIKYYSGLARYEFDVDIANGFKKAGHSNYLTLGKFGATASVTINGKPVTTVWERNSEIEITNFIKEGKNRFTISTTNPWRNRLIGDLIYPENKKGRWFASNLRENSGKVLIDKNSFLITSGLDSSISIISKK